MAFKLDAFLEDVTHDAASSSNEDSYDFADFYHLCSEVKKSLFKDANKSDDMLKIQKKAIQGHQEEVNYYLNEIETYLDGTNKHTTKFPIWYSDLASGIFHENWGFHGLFPWTKDEKSSSAKIIGDRIYFFQNGKQVLQEQRISESRLNQFKRALLLGNPEKRFNEPSHEVYMVDGTRITILNNTIETTFIFRKYVMQDYTFESLANLKTIDGEMIQLLELFVKCGFNVNFIGPVRSGKTTAMTTYQTYEDQSLEGTTVQTDPEMLLHLIMPKAPITQVIADGEELDDVTKQLMRSDSDYLIMGEAREGKALRLMLLVTKKGTRRVKGTFHTGDPTNFCFDVAQEISNIYGGNLWAYMLQVANGFQYLFEFAQMPYDKSVKKLKGIYEIRLNNETLEISSHQIVKYNSETDDWVYKFDLGENIERIGMEEDPIAFKQLKKELQRLEKIKPLKTNNVIISPYSKLMTRGV